MTSVTLQKLISLLMYYDKLEWYYTNYVGFAGFTVMVWDHVDTFTIEVELIWMRKKTLITWLFLLNRYLIPLGFVVNLFAYLHSWTGENFVRYEGAMSMIGISVVEIMMYLRIKALYSEHKWGKWIYGSVRLLFLVQTLATALLLTQGEPVPHTIVKACTMIYSDELGGIATASAWLPLLYDTVVFILTINCVLPKMERFAVSDLKKRLFEDGIIYYSVILGVTLGLTVMIANADHGVKNICAQLHLLLTVTMMSRITLNLKKAGAKGFTGRRQIEIATSPISFVAPEIYRLKDVHHRSYKSDDLESPLHLNRYWDTV